MTHSPQPGSGRTPGAPTDDDSILRLSIVGATKRFGGTLALDGVDFDVKPGEVHALLGENGAGKSTLMNIMSGVIGDYSGSMFLDGEPVTFPSPRAAQRAGIATVFQELDLVGGLTIADNLALGKEPRGPLWIVDSSMMRARAQTALDHVESTASPRDVVSSLRLGEQQTVMIAKALAQQANVLILDEPTAALTAVEVDRLFDLVRHLARRGVSIVYVSHRLEEIPQIADRVTIMREGRVVATVGSDTAQDRLVSLLTGRSDGELFPPRDTATSEVGLSLRNVTFRPARERAGWRAPRDVSFDVHAGEIVGLVGLLGAGRTELLETLAGAGPVGTVSGVVEVGDSAVAIDTVAQSLRAGIGYVPDDRRAGGFIPQRSVADNLVLTSLKEYSVAGFLSARRIGRSVTESIARFGIRTSSPSASILSLSGGNQQKVVIGRALVGSPRVLLLDEPTRGVDIGAKADIYRLIRARAREGASVLIASSELPELIGLCDRLLVIRDGRIVAEPAIDSSPAALIALAQQSEVPA